MLSEEDTHLQGNYNKKAEETGWVGTVRDSDTHIDDLGLSPGGSDLRGTQCGSPTLQY